MSPPSQGEEDLKSPTSRPPTPPQSGYLGKEAKNVGHLLGVSAPNLSNPAAG